jgi:phosphatidylethanolamine/phosphatidyl-N-methylethanolamine N-methyltransferase
MLQRMRGYMIAQRVKRKIGGRFDDEIRFFKGLLHGPRAVGAVLPTSMRTARKMASLIDTSADLPVLELGPGTGVITKAILERGIKPENLISIEYSDDFLLYLKAALPGVNFLQGDAFDLEKTLGDFAETQFDCVISGLPLLNFPMHKRVALIEDLLTRVPPGRPVVQFSYGPVSPVAVKPDSYTVKHFDFVFRNIPPAQIWLYHRPH